MDIVPLNDLGRLPHDVLEDLKESVNAVIASGQYFQGPATQRLEQALSQRFAGRDVVMVGNGTDALYLGLAALGVTTGSRVVTVANAGGYTTGVTLRLGATPILVDVDRHTAQLSLEHLKQTLANTQVDVVVATHLYGLVGQLEDISELCREHGVPLVEDCAQALGAATSRFAAGTAGDIATTSFYPTKNLGGAGDGGAVICADSSLTTRVRELAQYGWSERYIVSTPMGVNSRLDEIQAAVLCRLERDLDSNNDRRRSIVRGYSGALRGARSMIHTDDQRFIGHLAVMITADRDADRQLLSDMGIGTGVHYPVPDHQQPAWKGKTEFSDLANTDWLADHTVTLPCFPGMSDTEISRVTDALSRLPV